MNDKCAECGKAATELHHCIFGKNRKNSDRYKEECCVRLCSGCHYRLHNVDEQLAMKYRRLAQKRFEAKYGHSEFMRVFGRNYLDKEDWKE